MTPHQPVYIARWKVVAAFLALCLIAVGTAKYNDYRIDQAAKRIRDNAVSVEDLKQVNEDQNAVRAELATKFNLADVRACERIEALKTQNRVEARREFARLDATLELIGIAQSPAILTRAKDDLAHTLELNAPAEC